MKQFSTTACLVLFALLSIHLHAQSNNKNNMGTSNAGNMPYKADYSSNFQIGDPKYSATVLNAWKAYDNNQLETAAEYISDTVTAILADGTMVKGKDNFINSAKQYRSGFSAVKSNVTAWLSLKTPDHPDDHIVCIWGDEHDTKPDGTTQSVSLQEVWVFNKDNKLSYFQQFAGQMPKNQ
ncbi:MAG TPA: hypothetical protein VNS32_27965 [Flavisolibacter sp.]|nr:hypothetical protein [Flavisolibacter sp.]